MSWRDERSAKQEDGDDDDDDDKEEKRNNPTKRNFVLSLRPRRVENEGPYSIIGHGRIRVCVCIRNNAILVKTEKVGRENPSVYYTRVASFIKVLSKELESRDRVQRMAE